jgi:putative ABC transport system ATP-binding protein
VSALELCDVVKRYLSGDELIHAIEKVSLTVAEGEFVGVYGPSGSGKTTLLLLAAGLLAPDRGRVSFGELEISQLSAAEAASYRLHDVGFVFQTFHLIGGASAVENAAIKLLADGLSLREAKRHAQPWLERVGLGARAEHTPEQLSMGERQRVAIARALINEPRLLLTDEPTGNLDSRRSEETLGLLREICHERRIPGVLVTHDPLAHQFVDRVYTLRDGGLYEGLGVPLAVAPDR